MRLLKVFIVCGIAFWLYRWLKPRDPKAASPVVMRDAGSDAASNTASRP